MRIMERAELARLVWFPGREPPRDPARASLTSTATGWRTIIVKDGVIHRDRR